MTTTTETRQGKRANAYEKLAARIDKLVEQSADMHEVNMACRAAADLRAAAEAARKATR